MCTLMMKFNENEHVNKEIIVHSNILALGAFLIF
jgi:hypothetical protein